MAFKHLDELKVKKLKKKKKAQRRRQLVERTNRQEQQWAENREDPKPGVFLAGLRRLYRGVVYRVRAVDRTLEIAWEERRLENLFSFILLYLLFKFCFSFGYAMKYFENFQMFVQDALVLLLSVMAG
ncbi:hypothetical protein PoB_006605000 [Plakobranchus ocellatus]|uniref:Uncharacterized protein n=1 Tax=Plakobranchus ocellatus TaxID=259542 RepID=A0AAV4D625_9GAST|nr:hypothetical protein PoB_006605000 [Plakobranchus ocellatus]